MTPPCRWSGVDLLRVKGADEDFMVPSGASCKLVLALPCTHCGSARCERHAVFSSAYMCGRFLTC